LPLYFNIAVLRCDNVLEKRSGGPGKALEFFGVKRVGTLFVHHMQVVNCTLVSDLVLNFDSFSLNDSCSAASSDVFSGTLTLPLNSS